MENRKRRAVAMWLIAGVLMIVVEFVMGGVTRLTGSGLSITEWKPIMGALPPLSDADWNDAFSKYQQIAQFKYMNSHFTLDDFKFIFYWEWAHRLWARLIGLVFVIGFVFFYARKYFDKGMVKPFIVLFLLGGVQGFVGWKMVESGLNDTELYVKHTWLATHFLSASTLMCYTLWFATALLTNDTDRVSLPKSTKWTLGLVLLLFVQLAYGAFMAGMHAARSAATWPTINGDWVPNTVLTDSFVTNIINVQFVHRTLAYMLIIAITAWFIHVRRSAQSINAKLLLRTATWPMVLVIVQVILGITTLVCAPYIVLGKFGTYEWLAEAHQLVGLFLVMSVIVNLYMMTQKRGAHQ